MSARPRVCVYAEYLYPVVSDGGVLQAGGAEVQMALLAFGLADRGFEVSVVTCDFGQPDGLVVNGVRMHICFDPQAGLPILRFFHPRLSGALRALWRANADVYVVRGAGLWAGIVCGFTRMRRRRFVWMAAHDHDVAAALPDVHGLRDRWWARRAISRADVIVCQTVTQQRALSRAFGRESTVIMNSVNIPPEALDSGNSSDVVWLATYKPGKRPDWFTRFAERHPRLHCRMAGVVPTEPSSDGEWLKARAAAARCANLEVHPTIAHERIGEFLEGAAVFAHSSPSEGFPNTFLEAWSRGLPVVTCFDPDGIIERERLGACRRTYEEWEKEVERFAGDSRLRGETGARARAYAQRVHGSGAAHQALAGLLRGLARTPPA